MPIDSSSQSSLSNTSQGIPTPDQSPAASPATTEAQERDYSVEFKPKSYRTDSLYRLAGTPNNNKLRFGVIRPKVPVDDAQYIWLQSQPKSVRDQAENIDRGRTGDQIGTFLEKSRRTLPNGDRVEDSSPVHYMSQFIRDCHTPIPQDNRKRRKTANRTYKFKTYFPTSASDQSCPYWSVEFIETVLETKSKENLELKAKIQEAIKIQRKRNADAAKAAKAAKAAEAAARGHPVASSSASSKEYIRVGLECEMILDNELQ